ncbi:MAG TPA: TIGR03118 family protein [Roseiarcus sp.]|nr:TIGR03118 family protein [Roseiarcus sp.]
MTASAAELLGDDIVNGNSFKQTNLVSDGSVPAEIIDPNLINPWGLTRFPGGGPFWISDNNAGVSTFYNHGTKDGQVAIAPPLGQSGTGSPTGVVFNSTNGFDISQNGNTAPAFFIFATEDGTISGWNPSVNPNSSVIAVDNSKGGNPNGGDGAVYKGLAIGQTKDGAFLYAANFRNGSVDMFNSKFQLVKSFTDPTVPDGYAPFNVQVLDGKLFVTFAQQDASRHDDVAGTGHGFVDEFNLNGQMIERVASRGPLNSPWGLATAPKGFGEWSGDLLVGNFGDGTISIFNPTTDQYLGKLDRPNGEPFHETDLWSLRASGDNILFTAGLANESHGLFGELSPTFAPGPSMPSMAGAQSGWGTQAVGISSGHFGY